MELIRSIPLSKSTRDAWRTAGVSIVPRRRLESGRFNKDGVLINLGNLNVDLSNIRGVVFNSRETVRSASHPVALRRSLGEFLPEQTHKGKHWHKKGGFGGEGTRLVTGNCTVGDIGDSQRHVDGTEYRVITVGDVVVQASRKVGSYDGNGRHHFDFEWCGVDGIKTLGIIPILKEAIPNLPGWSHSIIGWDIIIGDKPYIIEANFSPGVNEATASRIVKQIGVLI